MKTYLLVFDDGSDPDVDLQSFVDALDDGAEMYALDGHVCFIKSNLSVGQLSEKFIKFAGSSFFFITRVSSSEYAGRMNDRFWGFIKEGKRLTAAE